MTPKKAEEKYIAFVKEAKKTHGYDAKRTTKADGTAIDPAKEKKFQELSKTVGAH